MKEKIKNKNLVIFIIILLINFLTNFSLYSDNQKIYFSSKKDILSFFENQKEKYISYLKRKNLFLKNQQSFVSKQKYLLNKKIIKKVKNAHLKCDLFSFKDTKQNFIFCSGFFKKKDKLNYFLNEKVFNYIYIPETKNIVLNGNKNLFFYIPEIEEKFISIENIKNILNFKKNFENISKDLSNFNLLKFILNYDNDKTLSNYIVIYFSPIEKNSFSLLKEIYNKQKRINNYKIFFISNFKGNFISYYDLFQYIKKVQTKKFYPEMFSYNLINLSLTNIPAIFYVDVDKKIAFQIDFFEIFNPILLQQKSQNKYNLFKTITNLIKNKKMVIKYNIFVK